MDIWLLGAGPVPIYPDSWSSTLLYSPFFQSENASFGYIFIYIQSFYGRDFPIKQMDFPHIWIDPHGTLIFVILYSSWTFFNTNFWLSQISRQSALCVPSHLLEEIKNQREKLEASLFHNDYIRRQLENTVSSLRRSQIPSFFW